MFLDFVILTLGLINIANYVKGFSKNDESKAFNATMAVMYLFLFVNVSFKYWTGVHLQKTLMDIAMWVIIFGFIYEYGLPHVKKIRQ